MQDKKMLSEAMNYLMDPSLVARIQNFFGVDVHDTTKLSKVKREKYKDEELSIRNRHVTKNNGSPTYEFQKNGYNSSIKHSTNEKENLYSIVNDHEELTGKPPVTNYFWYYFFLFSSELGDEIFYTLFIAYWFWNIDGEVGRKVIFVWAVVMTTGQIVKDIVQWPRPACPPAVRLQDKWSEEYGMPSTHASVSISIPFSVIIFTMNKYHYSVPLGITMAIIWSASVCVSRLYLGMHTVLDVIAGLLLAIILMIPLIPIVDHMDHYFVTTYWAPVILTVISITLIIYYPTTDKWSPTRRDTTMVLSVVVGLYVGAWLNQQSGLISSNLYPPPYDVVWPSYSTLYKIILRTILGFCLAVPIKFIAKSLTYTTMCAIMRTDRKKLMNSEDSLKNRDKIIVDLVYRFTHCFTFGFAVNYILPKVFTYVGIDRSNFYNGM